MKTFRLNRVMSGMLQTIDYAIDSIGATVTMRIEDEIVARHRFAIDEARDSARKWIAQGFSWAHENEENYYSYEEMQAIHDAEIAAEEAYVRLSEMGYFHPQAHAEAMEDLRRHEEEFPNGYCG